MTQENLKRPTDFKKIVEAAQQEVARWPDWMRTNRDAVHVPIRASKGKKK